MISKIENSDITRSALKYFHKALENMRLRKETALVFPGKVDNPDTLVMLADFFLRVHDINRSIAAGVCRDKLIIIFRMAGPRKNAGKLAENAFGDIGSAGGHKNMARAEVHLNQIDQKVLNKDGGLERWVMRRLQSQKQPKKHSSGTPSTTGGA